MESKANTLEDAHTFYDDVLFASNCPLSRNLA
jgi:hypothetical protein